LSAHILNNIFSQIKLFQEFLDSNIKRNFTMIHVESPYSHSIIRRLPYDTQGGLYVITMMNHDETLYDAI